jgi:TrpR-related protein YerC/YecD
MNFNQKHLKAFKEQVLILHQPLDKKMETEYLKKALYEVFIKIKTASDAEEFLKDICSAKELEQMAGRLYAAKLLAQGKTYIEVTNQTNVSSATLSRISRCLKNGKGYNKFLGNK